MAVRSPVLSFPRRNSKDGILDKWLKFVRLSRGDPLWQPGKHTAICSTHFYAECFIKRKDGEVYLVNNAIPTVMTDKPKPLKIDTSQHKPEVRERPPNGFEYIDSERFPASVPMPTIHSMAELYNYLLDPQVVLADDVADSLNKKTTCQNSGSRASASARDGNEMAGKRFILL